MSTADFVAHFVFVELSDVLYDFLPGSGNANHAFPIAAAEAGVAQHWQGGSKRPAILSLLENTYARERSRFCPLVLAIVRHSAPWRRGKGSPLSRDEVSKLNAALRKLEIKIPELHREEFLSTLAGAPVRTEQPAQAAADPVATKALQERLLELTKMQPIPRGFAFERFLNDLFAEYKLDPRRSFRLQGEQIDGSFELGSHTYLLEAKWQNESVGATLLRSFSTSVMSKSAWSRGLYVSYTGFSPDGLAAFGRGLSTPIICIDGLDLAQTLEANVSLTDLLQAKARRAAESGNPFVRIADLKLKGSR